MIQRYNQKLPVCSYCLKPGHTSMQCGSKPKKTLNIYNGLKVSSSFGGRRKPMAKVGKQGKKTAAAVAKWKREYTGSMTCHYCHRPIETLVAEHMESKARRPDLRTDPSNFVPTCSPCNEKKGSKSHDEIPHDCNLV